MDAAAAGGRRGRPGDLGGAVLAAVRSLLTLVTLVGVWAIFYGVSEIFAAFTIREAGKRAERLVS